MFSINIEKKKISLGLYYNFDSLIEWGSNMVWI